MFNATHDPESADADEPYRERAVYVAARYVEALHKNYYSEIWHELVADETKEILASKAYLQRRSELATAFDMPPQELTQEYLSFAIANNVESTRAGYLKGLRNSLDRGEWLPADFSHAEVAFLNDGAVVVMPGETEQLVVPLMSTSSGYRVDLETLMVASNTLQVREFIDHARRASNGGDFSRAIQLLEDAGRLQRAHSLLQQYAWQSLFTARRQQELQQDAASLQLIGPLLQENRVFASVDVAAALRRDEDDTVEFKAEMPPRGSGDAQKKLAKEFAAFATSGGGCVYFGITNAKVVVGLTEVDTSSGRDEFRQRIDNMCKDSIRPAISVRTFFLPHPISDLTVTVPVVVVPQGPEPVYYVDHRPYLRSGQSSRPAESHEVMELHRRYFINQGLIPENLDERP